MDFSLTFFSSELNQQDILELTAEDQDFPDDLSDPSSDLLARKSPTFDFSWPLGSDPFGDLLAIPDEELFLTPPRSDEELFSLRSSPDLELVPWDELILRPEQSDALILHQEPVDALILHQEPVEELILHQEPVEELILHQEPVEELILHQEPADAVILHQEPVDALILHQEPVDALILHQEPVDALILHQEPVDALILQPEQSDALHSVVTWNAHEERLNILDFQSNENDTEQLASSNPEPTQFTKFACSFCQRKFGSEASLNYHSISHASVQSAHTNNCPHCEYTYRSKSELTRHFKRCHVEEMFTCHMCLNVFVSFHEYDAHVSAKICRPFACTSCDETFMRVAQFRRHQALHGDLPGTSQASGAVNDVDVQVDLQEDGFVEQGSPIAGVSGQNQVLETRVADNGDFGGPGPSRTPTRTPLKKTIFKPKTAWMSVNQRRNISPPREVPDPNQDARVPVAEQAADPIPTPVRNHCCPLCTSRFDQRTKLMRHSRLKHAPQRFSCDVCTKRFVRADHFKIHMRRHHHQKICVCEFCQKRFCQKSDLNRHRKYVHLGWRRGR